LHKNCSKKILIVGPSWVGDMVMTQSLFKIIKQRDPSATIDVLAPLWSIGLLERMPEVSRYIISPFQHGSFHLQARFQLGKKLRQDHYDQVIFIPNSFKSALAPFLGGIPLRTGWHGEFPRRLLLNDSRRLDKSRLQLMFQRFAALGLPADEPYPETWPWPSFQILDEKVTRALEKYSLPRPQSPLLVIAPGAEFGPSKRWPVSYFAEAANAKLKEGWTVWLLGSIKDQAVSKEINALTQMRCQDLTGKTNLAEAIDLLSLVNMVLTNDSGLMHIAAALAKPIVAVYGPTPADITPPLAHRYESLYLDIDCRPCMKRVCPLGHHKCMVDLKPASVLAAIERLQT
jgi:heptosyltransferase-2